MTFPDPTYPHVHVSENETGLDEDCLWCSAVEALRWGGLNIPATLREAEAMRAASGEPPEGGSNLVDLQKGAKARYNIDLTRHVTGSTGVLRVTPKGTAAVITGRLSNFPLGHTLRRHLPLYTGGHAVAIYRVDDRDRFWWCDPLGPATGYDGQWVSESQVATFMRGFGDFTTVTRGEYALPESDTEAADMRLDIAGRAIGTAVVRTQGATLFRLDHDPVNPAQGSTAPVPGQTSRNVMGEAKLREALGPSLPVGEPMLLVSWAGNEIHLLRSADTDWPEGRFKCPPEDCADEVAAAVEATKASAKVVFA
jgi:hypothetical protein